MSIVLKGGLDDGHPYRVNEWTRRLSLDRSRNEGFYAATGETDPDGRVVFVYTLRRSAADRAKLRPVRAAG